MSNRAPDREKVADNIVHLLGITSGIVAATALLLWAAMTRPPHETAALVIYCAGLLAMLCCSGAYHMIRAPDWKGTLRRLDHAAIFLKIAGTYTPFALVKMGGTSGLVLFLAVWSVALLGAAAKLWLTTQWDRLAIGVYLALGWSGVATLQALSAAIDPTAFLLLGIGGVVYSVGVVFFVWRSLPYHNAIWHVFVLAGTACHFAAIAIAIAH